MTAKEAKESILSIQVDAVLAGQDLRPFEPVEVLTGGITISRTMPDVGLDQFRKSLGQLSVSRQ